MADTCTFDHLAIGVERWRDGLPRFAGQFGGRWSHGGEAAEFAPCQLVYAHDMRIELIAPGASGDGFMRRFLDRSGPGAHHITFKVPSLEDTIRQLSERGLAVFGVSMDRPAWREAFVHPKESGLGTLLQVAQVDEQLIGTMTGRQPAPPGFPEVQGEPGGDRLDRPDRGVGGRRARAADRGAARGAGGGRPWLGPGSLGHRAYAGHPRQLGRAGCPCAVARGPAGGGARAVRARLRSTRWRWSGARPGASASRTTR